MRESLTPMNKLADEVEEAACKLERERPLAERPMGSMGAQMIRREAPAPGVVDGPVTLWVQGPDCIWRPTEFDSPAKVWECLAGGGNWLAVRVTRDLRPASWAEGR